MLTADLPPYCDRCQSARVDLFWQVCNNGTRHLRAHCGRCGKLLKYVDQNANRDEARRQGDRVYRSGGVLTRVANADGSRSVQRGLFDPQPVADASAVDVVADAGRAPTVETDLAEWPEPAASGLAPTWSELCDLEPRLLELAELADRCRPGLWPESEKFCANRVWYGRCHRPGLLNYLSRLVGPTSGQAGMLGSRSALDVAGRALFARLASCGVACGCDWWPGMPSKWRVRRRRAA